MKKRIMKRTIKRSIKSSEVKSSMNRKKNNLINRNLLMSLIVLLIIILFAFLSIQGYLNQKYYLENYHANSLDIINQRMSSVLIEVNNFPRTAGNDVLFLSRLSSMKDIVNGEEDISDEIEDLKLNFLEFSKENIAYYQLRYINESGDEVVRVDFDGEESYIIPNSELQNKDGRYYFEETMNIDEGEVFISKLDLNKEQGIIENRGTEENPIHVPMIRYATPLMNNNGERKGIIVSNVYADYFLEDIRRSGREGEKIFLIDSDGYYLAHSNRSKEYGFMFDDKDDNFYTDYPEIIINNLTSNENVKIETEESVFMFRYIYPTVSSFEVNEGSEKVFGDNPEEKYYWVLVSVSDKESLEKVSQEMEDSYFLFTLVSVFVILMIIVLMYLIWRIK